MSAQPKGLDWLMLCFMVMTWGSSFLFVKLSVQWAGPFWLAAFRLLAASLFFLVAKPLFRGQWPRGRQWVPLAILGFIGNALPFVMIGTATREIPSSAAALIMSTAPMIVMVAGIFLLPDERVTRMRVVGLIGGLAGVALIIFGAPGALAGNWGSGVLPYFLLVIAAAGYAMVAIYGRRLGAISQFARTFGMLATGAVFAVAAAILFEPFPATFELAPALMVTHLGVVPSGISIFLLMHLLDRTSSGFASLTNYIVPMIAIALGNVLLGEQLTLLQYGGAALVLLAVWLASRTPASVPVA